MRSRARLLSHPIHPMLIVVPSTLLPALLVFDLLYRFAGVDALWPAGFWLAVLGVAATVAAMVPGIIDLSAIPDGTRAHRIGVYHTIVGSSVLVAYLAAVAVRWPLGGDPDRFLLAAGVDLAGTLLVTVQGWLGGELVYKHHVGVDAPGEGGDPVPLETGSAAKGRRSFPERGRPGP